MMTARRLLEAEARVRRRRRATKRSLLGRLPAAAVAAVVAALLAAELHRRLGGFGQAAAGQSTFTGTVRLWLAAVLAGHTLVVFGAPHRLFWREDSAFLSRLPIAGSVYLRAALWRSMRSAALVSLPCAAAAVTFVPAVGWPAILRMECLVVMAFAWAAFLGPAAAVAAGAVVASDRAQAVIGQMGGEFAAPRTSWLGILPGVTASALVVIAVFLIDWMVAPSSQLLMRGFVVVGGAVVIAGAAAAAALNRADAIIPDAVREVAALDVERLAHVERSTPSPIERLWFAWTTGSRGARLVADKDASLLRRRHPSAYVLGPVGVLIVWGMAAFGGGGALPWAGAVLGSLAAYSVMMAGRATRPPVEIPRLLGSLPVGTGQAVRGKRAQVLLRAVMWILVGGVPLAIANTEDAVLGWSLVGGAFVVAVVGGLAAVAVLSER